MGLMTEDNKSVRYDIFLIAIIVFLTFLGLVTLYSASYLFASNQPTRFASGFEPVVKNIFICIAMLVVFPFLAMIKLDFFIKWKLIIVLLVGTVVLNIFPFFPVFRKENFNPQTDAMRWIYIYGISFQPSELIKFVLPVYSAYILTKNKDRLDTFVRGPLPLAIWTAIFCILVLFQNNFSEAVLIVLTSFTICFLAGIGLQWFVVGFIAVVSAGVLLIVSDSTGYRLQRLINFGQHEADPTGMGFQITNSLEAIRAGGFWGKGIGQGSMKISVPEVHGDFIFASYAEESGFLGVLLYFIIIGAFTAICYYVAWKNKNMHHRLLALGLVTPIIIQTIMNIAVVTNIIPTTGVTLPFFSAGGSSLLITLASSALLVNITRRHILSNNTERNYDG